MSDDGRVLAALEVLGWPDDRKQSAHVEEDGYEVTPAGHYWSIVCDVLAAAGLAAELERTETSLSKETKMINGDGSVTAGDSLDLEYHGDKYDLATKRGTLLALRRNGQEIRLTMDGRTVLALTDEEADGLAYNLACAALAAMAEPKPNDA